MPTLTDSGLTIDDAGVLALAIREALDGRLEADGYPAGDYDGTLEGSYTFAFAELAYRVEQGLQLIVDSLDPDTAMGAALIGYASQVGIQRRPATASTWVIRAAVASGSYTLPAGTVIQGGGTDGLPTWTTDAAVVLTSTPAQVDLTCQQTGPVAAGIPSGTVLRVLTPQPVTVTLADSGDGSTLGRAQESYGSLRVRRRRSLVAVSSPTPDGVRAGMLALSWVTHATVARTAPGIAKTTVVPAPATAAQQQELVDAIGSRLAVGTETLTTGAAGSGSYVLSDGSLRPVAWFVGASQSVAVVAVLALESGYALGDVRPVVLEAIAAAFEALDVGEGITFAGVFCAIAEVGGVRGLTLTLDGGSADITPASTDVLTASATVT